MVCNGWNLDADIRAYFSLRPVVCGRSMEFIARNATDTLDAAMKKSSMRSAEEAGSASSPEDFISWAREHSAVEQLGYLS